jgi:hypothetical protein
MDENFIQWYVKVYFYDANPNLFDNHDVDKIYWKKCDEYDRIKKKLKKIKNMKEDDKKNNINLFNYTIDSIKNKQITKQILDKLSNKLYISNVAVKATYSDTIIIPENKTLSEKIIYIKHRLKDDMIVSSFTYYEHNIFNVLYLLPNKVQEYINLSFGDYFSESDKGENFWTKVIDNTVSICLSKGYEPYWIMHKVISISDFNIEGVTQINDDDMEYLYDSVEELKNN